MSILHSKVSNNCGNVSIYTKKCKVYIYFTLHFTCKVSTGGARAVEEGPTPAQETLYAIFIWLFGLVICSPIFPKPFAKFRIRATGSICNFFSVIWRDRIHTIFHKTFDEILDKIKKICYNIKKRLF